MIWFLRFLIRLPFALIAFPFVLGIALISWAFGGEDSGDFLRSWFDGMILGE